jgi:hypothetical protein
MLLSVNIAASVRALKLLPLTRLLHQESVFVCLKRQPDLTVVTPVVSGRAASRWAGEGMSDRYDKIRHGVASAI